MSLVENVQAYLGDAGIIDGLTGWPSVRRRMHDQSDKLVVLYEDGGFPEVGDAALLTPGVLIRVRGTAKGDTGEALAVAEACRAALHGLNGETLGDTRYMLVRARSAQPVWAGFDEKGRPHFTIGFLATLSAN